MSEFVFLSESGTNCKVIGRCFFFESSWKARKRFMASPDLGFCLYPFD